VTVKALCTKAGMSRQNFYKEKRKLKEQAIDEGLVIELVREQRRIHPRMGVRKLQGLIREGLLKAELQIGRDKLFALLKREKMLVPPLPRSPRTTNAYHTLPVFRNEIKDIEPTGPDQIWVSDITYVRTMESFLYLSLIMDLYSRKVVGYHIGYNLEGELSLNALKMALRGLKEGYFPIHHSDRGCQYCCHDYVEMLEGHKLGISMTEENHCYENAHAERLNGILKQEYGLGGQFKTRGQARVAIEQAIRVYNHLRPHGSLGGRVPEEVHEKAA